MFDSWVGALGPQDYQEHIAPHMRHILEDVEKTGVPVIHFGTGTSTLLELQRDAGGTVIGVDYRLPLDEAHRRLGDGVALQGNLDPLLLLAPWALLERRVRDVLERGRVASGHVFNLGHGIVPETPPDVVRRVVELVHDASRR